MVDGHRRSKRRFVTAQVIRRAVAINEINFYWLKARMLADGHRRSKRRFVTARVIRRAVAFSEMTFKQVLEKNWYKKDIPSANFKINKGDCFWAHNSSGRAVDLAQNELISPPVEHDLNLIWHCTCALFFKIDCWLGAYAVAHRQVWKNDCQLEKSARIKGSIHASESGICCLCHWLDEARQEQRQQACLGIRNLLPPPLTRWNSPRAKAANTPWNQEFAASAIDPMKPIRSKGSKHVLRSRICCLRHWLDETRQEQRQQTRFGIKNLLPPASIRRKTSHSKAAITPRNQEFAAFAMCMKKLTLLNGKPANQPLFTGRKFGPGIIIIV